MTAARLGATTTIIGKLGDDSFGHSYLLSLKKEGIFSDRVRLTNKALTGKSICHIKVVFKLREIFVGVAQILVEDSGQNSIVIVSGANDHLTPDDVASSRETVSKAKIMLSVLEIPRKTVLAGLKLASELGGKSYCN